MRFVLTALLFTSLLQAQEASAPTEKPPTKPTPTEVEALKGQKLVLELKVKEQEYKDTLQELRLLSGQIIVRNKLDLDKWRVNWGKTKPEEMIEPIPSQQAKTEKRVP